jgi:hypothetical protein
VDSQFELCHLSWQQVVYAYLGGNNTEIDVLSERDQGQEYDKKARSQAD